MSGETITIEAGLNTGFGVPIDGSTLPRPRVHVWKRTTASTIYTRTSTQRSRSSTRWVRQGLRRTRDRPGALHVRPAASLREADELERAQLEQLAARETASREADRSRSVRLPSSPATSSAARGAASSSGSVLPRAQRGRRRRGRSRTAGRRGDRGARRVERRAGQRRQGARAGEGALDLRARDIQLVLVDLVDPRRVLSRARAARLPRSPRHAWLRGTRSSAGARRRTRQGRRRSGSSNVRRTRRGSIRSGAGPRVATEPSTRSATHRRAPPASPPSQVTRTLAKPPSSSCAAAPRTTRSDSSSPSSAQAIRAAPLRERTYGALQTIRSKRSPSTGSNRLPRRHSTFPGR